jgi:transcription elongation factor GreA-like protein
MFIDEMGIDEVREITDKAVPFQNTYKTEFKPKKLVIPHYEDFSQEEKSYRVGGYVRHASWGNGKIVNISGFGIDTKLTISFEGVQKKVLAQYAKLEVL